MAFVAKKIFLTKGVGKHRERLSSFELALRNAGIAACNIVRVSSIFPPNCKLISRSEGLKHLKPGQVAFTVISENSTKEPHRLIAASIGLALPSDKSMYGYLSEHHSFGEAPAFLRRNEFPPGNGFRIRAATQPSPAHRLRADAQAVVVTL